MLFIHYKMYIYNIVTLHLYYQNTYSNMKEKVVYKPFYSHKSVLDHINIKRIHDVYFDLNNTTEYGDRTYVMLYRDINN